MKRLLFTLALLGIFGPLSSAAEWGMQTGNPAMQSAHALAFGPDGVLFVGDTKAATVFAISTGDKSGEPNEVDLHAHGVDTQIAKAVGVDADAVTINDLAVNPTSGTAYLSLSVGKAQTPAIVKLLPNGDIEKMPLEKVNFSKVELPNPPADKVVGKGRRAKNRRNESITDIAFSDGKVLVSGVSGDKGASNVRELVFPFAEVDKGVNVEIYHGMHGKYESTASVKTFVPFTIDGKPHLLAGFQCTPLVKFPVEAFRGATSVRGTTIAELGNWNRPLDMIVYEKDGKDFVLLTNTARGVMKISTEDIERSEGITEKVKDTAGQSFETIESLENVLQMDRLNDAHALVLAKTDEGLDVHTIDLP